MSIETCSEDDVMFFNWFHLEIIETCPKPHLVQSRVRFTEIEEGGAAVLGQTNLTKASTLSDQS
jgi:hypothetical protein